MHPLNSAPATLGHTPIVESRHHDLVTQSATPFLDPRSAAD